MEEHTNQTGEYLNNHGPRGLRRNGSKSAGQNLELDRDFIVLLASEDLGKQRSIKVEQRSL